MMRSRTLHGAIRAVRALGGAINATGTSAPDAGSLSICAYCGAVSVFTDDRLLREPSEEELEAIKASDAWAIVEKVRENLLPRPEGRVC